MYKNVQNFNLTRAHTRKFGLPFLRFVRSEFYSCPFHFLFLGPFTLAAFWVSYPFWLPKTVDYNSVNIVSKYLLTCMNCSYGPIVSLAAVIRAVTQRLSPLTPHW